MSNPWAGLAHQSRGRTLSADEMALAKALESIFTNGAVDFDEVSRRLSAQGVLVPSSQGATWSRDLLERELTLINHSLDEAYARGPTGT